MTPDKKPIPWNERLFSDWKKKHVSAEAKDYTVQYKDVPVSETLAGFSGPVLTGPLPEELPILSKRQVREGRIKLPRDICTHAMSESAREVVFIYPVSFRNFERLSALDPENRTEAELMGLDIGGGLFSMYEDTRVFAEKRGLVVSTMPVFKLTENSSVAAQIAPVRFWSPKAPSKDGLFVIMDDIVEKGRTVAAIHALLKEHGIPDTHICCIYTRQKEEYQPIHLTDGQKQQIAELRADDPEVAERTDVVLARIGISGMEALFCKEARYLGIDGKGAPAAVDAALERAYTESIGAMPAIPHVSEAYLARIERAGYLRGSRSR
ncbi:MAG: phosphoribosyltransferase [Proteobacteria bacterium]|nr:phosphoribosyltransferase [Pseudomonadota bacterium]